MSVAQKKLGIIVVTEQDATNRTKKYQRSIRLNSGKKDEVVTCFYIVIRIETDIVTR